MAALSIKPSFPTKRGPLSQRKPYSRAPPSISCQIRDPLGSPDSDEKKKEKQPKPWTVEPYSGIERLGKGLKDSLNPKRKGDWKDVLLMSISFAVYVYMSQKIVCAYCAWISMIKQF